MGQRSIEDLLEEAAERTGWNDESKLAVLIEFINQYQFNYASFEVYLEEKVQEELCLSEA